MSLIPNNLVNIVSFFQQKVDLHQNACYTHTIYFQCEKWFCLSYVLQYLQQKDCFWKRRQPWDGLVKHINCYTKTHIQSIQPLTLISGNRDVPTGDKGIFGLQTTTEWCRQNRPKMDFMQCDKEYEWAQTPNDFLAFPMSQMHLSELSIKYKSLLWATKASLTSYKNMFWCRAATCDVQ